MRSCGCRPRGCIEQDVSQVQVAHRLRVSPNRPTSGGGAGGPAARRRWRRKGPAARVPADRTQLARLRTALEQGPAAWGWDRGPAVDPGPGHHADRPAVPRALHPARHLILTAPDGLHPAGTVPGRPSVTRPRSPRGGPRLGEGTRLAAATRAWICFEDEAGQNLRPPKARTWAPPRSHPRGRVSGKGSGRVSVAGLVCLRPGARGRLFYRLRVHRAARASAAACPKPITPA